MRYRFQARQAALKTSGRGDAGERRTGVGPVEQTIRSRVRELGRQISNECAGKQVVLISVLRGALVFTADLMRCIEFPVTVDFVHASSYGMGSSSSREVRIKKDIETDITGRHVLLVDCIIDTGETLACLIKRYRAMRPASVRTVVLLDKAPAV